MSLMEGALTSPSCIQWRVGKRSDVLYIMVLLNLTIAYANASRAPAYGGLGVLKDVEELKKP